MFAYANGNPVMMIDPDGRMAILGISVWVWIGAALIGAIASTALFVFAQGGFSAMFSGRIGRGLVELLGIALGGVLTGLAIVAGVALIVWVIKGIVAITTGALIWLGLIDNEDRPNEPIEVSFTVEYRGNGYTHGSPPASHDENLTVPGGSITISQPGNMLRAGHLFGGWRDPAGRVIQPGTHPWTTTDVSGPWILNAVWNPIVLPQPHPTLPGAPRGPFYSPDAAARAWANHMFSTSWFTRHEHSATIYRTAPGVYHLTETNRGSPHRVPITWRVGQSVATIHTHPNTPCFTSGDINLFHDLENKIYGYVATPSGWGASSAHLRKYTIATGNRETLGAVALRNLSNNERILLASLYHHTWIGTATHPHLPCHGRSGLYPNPPFTCNYMQWPTHPWPPR